MNALAVEPLESAMVEWSPREMQDVYLFSAIQRTMLVYRPEPAPKWRAIVEARLAKLQKQPVGWDGYNGRPPRKSVSSFALSVLESVMTPSIPAPSIVPMSGGGLQLEWHVGGADIELTIYAPRETELSAEWEDGREPIDEIPLADDFSKLAGALEGLA